MNEGRLVSNQGMDIAMDQFPDQFEEYQVPYSHALQCRRKGGARISSDRSPAGTCVPIRPGPKSSNWPAKPGSPGPAATPMSASSPGLSKRPTRSMKPCG